MNIQQLTRLFWDVDTHNLSHLDKDTVIARTLSQGTYTEIQRLFHTYEKESILKIFKGLKQGALPERRRAYFSLILT